MKANRVVQSEDALETGELAAERYANYVKLQRELAFLDRKMDRQAQAAERDKWKKVRKVCESIHRRKNEILKAEARMQLPCFRFFHFMTNVISIRDRAY